MTIFQGVNSMADSLPDFYRNENSSLINTDIKNGDFEQASTPRNGVKLEIHE